jgi:membrane-associated phospholipid phosphatase
MTSNKPSKPNALFDASGHATDRAMTLAMAACLVLVVFCIAFVDRPVANYAHDVLRVNEPIYKRMTQIVDPIPVYAGLVTAWYAIAALFGRRPGPRGAVALRIALAILVAIALKEQLKFLAGRTWPETWTNNNPSYIKDGVYGFFPMKAWFAAGGGRGYHAFPSGHMTAISVAAVSLALVFPRWRWLAAVPMAIVAIGMIGANYHWVSDLIAGGFLGTAVAVAAHRLGRRD